MAIKPRIRNSEELFDKLEAQGPVFIGMVKPIDGETSAFLFSRGSSCTGWIRVPVASIEDVELIQHVRCGEHTHPFVKIRLSKPQTPEGELFSKLPSLTETLMPQVGPTLAGARFTGSRPMPGGIGAPQIGDWCYDDYGNPYRC